MNIQRDSFFGPLLESRDRLPPTTEAVAAVGGRCRCRMAANRSDGPWPARRPGGAKIMPQLLLLNFFLCTKLAGIKYSIASRFLQHV